MYKRSVAITDGKPVAIITFPDDIETNTPNFHIRELENIILRGKAQRLPIFIVSITGVFRSGKSFLMNLMKTYLDYYSHHQTDNGWEKSRMKIEGGIWARSKVAVTKGIWMWDRPYIINDVAILLMDCQGTGDAMLSSPTLDNLILYMGLQMATVQILNIQKTLQASDLERLNLCADYAAVDAEDGTIFDTLVFLVRDWEADDNYGEKRHEFHETISLTSSPAVKKFGKEISEAFRHITSFALPHPGKKVAAGSDQDRTLTLEGVDDDFLKPAKSLFQKLFVELTEDSQLRNGKTTIRKFKALKERTIDSELGSIIIQTAAEALEESLIYQAFVQASAYYNDKMHGVYTTQFQNEHQLKAKLKSIVDESIEKFNGQRNILKYKASATKKKYLDLLKQKYETIDERKVFIQMAQHYQSGKVEYENQFTKGNTKLEEMKKQQRLLAEAAAQNFRVRGGMRVAKATRADVVNREGASQDLRTREENRVEELKRNEKKIRQAEVRRRQEEKLAEQEKLKLLAEEEAKHKINMEQKQPDRLKLLNNAQERLRQERKRMEEVAEQLRKKNDKNAINEDERWLKEVEKDQSRCAIM